MTTKEFEHIFKSHYNDIYHFIYHYVMDADEAQDLTQDVFISLYENRHNLPPLPEIKQYLLTSAKNRCISYFRHRNVIDRHALKCFESLLFSASSQYDTTYDELFMQLNLAMEKLSPLQQQIIRLKLEDKNYTDIAQELGVTPSQIHKNIKKAYDKIRSTPLPSDNDNSLPPGNDSSIPASDDSTFPPYPDHPDTIIAFLLLHLLSGTTGTPPV